MLVNKSIPSLFNGVSQQPPTLRHDTQAELHENFYPTIATGLRKRPPTRHVAKMVNSPVGAATVHVINRDSNERYAVAVTNGSIRVFSLLDGSERTVTYPNGTTYLASSAPQTDFSLVTVADYTFVLNKSQQVRALTPDPVRPTNLAYFSLISFVNNIAYTITVNGIQATVLTSTDNHDTTWLAGQMQTALQAALGSGYSVAIVTDSSVIRVRCDTGPITSAAIHDGFGNTATQDLFNSVQSFSKLPSKMDPGYTIKIIGSPTDGNSSYYVEFKDGGWVEAVQPGLSNGFIAASMPHKLVRQADGSFVFQEIEWDRRKSGDEVSCPTPSFVGRTITDIFYYRGRLGLLADENVCLSRTGQYYDFWPRSATAVIDTDPIDTNVGTNKVSLLKFAVPFDKSLLLFSDQTQFQLTGGQELLSPKTVRADVATEFESGTDARPVGVGQAVYFGVTSGTHTSLREYYVDATTLTNDATDVTAHVPTYIPSGLFRLAASSSEDVIFALCRSEPNVVYVYKFFWTGNQKQQSAWLKFILDPAASVLGAEFINNKCYIVVNRQDGLYLETMDLQPDISDAGMGFVVHLDRGVYVTGSYNAGNNTTSFTLPYPVPPSGYTMVAGTSFTGKVGKRLVFSANGSNTVSVPGNWTAGPVFFGQDYTARYRFSEQHVKDQNQVAITNGKLKLRRFYLDFTDSGYFRVEVQPKARDVYSYPFTGKTLGTDSATLGVPSIESGTFKFPVLTSNLGVRIDLINDSYLPSTFQSAGWDGEFVTFGRRM